MAVILYGLLLTAAAAGALTGALVVEAARSFRRANGRAVTPSTPHKES